LIEMCQDTLIILKTRLKMLEDLRNEAKDLDKKILHILNDISKYERLLDELTSYDESIVECEIENGKS